MLIREVQFSSYRTLNFLLHDSKVNSVSLFIDISHLIQCMWYALESGCRNSPDAALITTATQYCKMNEAYSRAYPSAIIPGPLLHKTHLKRSMVPCNDLGVPCRSWATERTTNVENNKQFSLSPRSQCNNF